MAILITVLFWYFVKIAGYIILWFKKKRKVAAPPYPKDEVISYSVDIILPMFNEEKVILRTINNLLRINYESYNIIVVDDGSTDRCLEIVTEHFRSHPRIKILSQKNKGKALALNFGIKMSRSDIVLCVDADTLVRSDVIDKILPYFLEKKVAGVSGYLKVGNKKNLLTNIQYVEYITNENFERSVFDSINGIMIVPGAIGAFRRSALTEVGGYARDVLTEDCDLSFRLLSKNYIIRNAFDAFGFTEAPINCKMFFRQRVRWKVGTFQVLIKYHKILLLSPNKALAYVVVPYKWIFGMILPLLTPLIDYFFLYESLILHRYIYLPYYLAFVLCDASICILALWKRRERAVFMILVVFQRFSLRSLTLFSYLHIIFQAARGNVYKWNKVVRYGNVELEEVENVN